MKRTWKQEAQVLSVQSATFICAKVRHKRFHDLLKIIPPIECLRWRLSNPKSFILADHLQHQPPGKSRLLVAALLASVDVAATLGHLIIGRFG